MNVSTNCFESWAAAALRWTCALSLAGVATLAWPHQGSEGYVSLQQQGDLGARLQVDVALRDLEAPLKLDADGDGRLTAGELRAAWPAIDGYVRAHVALAGCELRPGVPPQSLATRQEIAYAALAYEAQCVSSTQAPAIRYALFKDIDETHRATARVEWGGTVRTDVLDPRQATAPSPAGEGAFAFVREGVHHIVTGYDHVLFLLCLLLPSVMRRTGGGWAPVDRLGQAVWPVLGIVTAFTAAHSITLALAALRWVSIPASVIEPAIAATIVLAALDNLRPVLGRRRTLVTFLFGLIHGFGFAGVLDELQLPASAFAGALFQFNLGLELGQAAIVAAVAALLFLARQSRAYVPWVVRGGSVAAMAVGALWLVERTADISLLPL